MTPTFPLNRFGGNPLAIFGLICLAWSGAASTAWSADAWTVTVTGGQVRGVEKVGVQSFKGVPFAAPPIGDLRWKPPQPITAWEGVKLANRFGPAPMQPALLAGLMGSQASEDCLYLNVWTAAKSPDERRPVMVWIYGGAFTMGATSLPVYDGSQFARKGVVLVSMAYRVGPFGFLAHPELSKESGKGSGCYGIQDQIAGLRWVKENIAKFGGDPSCVTIFGESAGGTSVAALVQSPAAKGLFHRAICESGGMMAPAKRSPDQPGALTPSLSYAQTQGVKFVQSLGVNNIKEARALPADVIQKQKLVPCWPVVDGDTIVDDPYALYQQGRFNDTPVLLGTNSDDGGMFAPSVTAATFEKLVRDHLGPATDGILAVYPHATDAQAKRASRELVRDGFFAWPTWAWAKLQSEKGKGKAYLYYFDYGSSTPGEVGHAAEIPYVFGNLGGWFMPASSPENRAVSDQVMSYWVNFAKTGDPNGPGLPKWPAFNAQAMNTLSFERTPKVSRTPNLEKIEAFDAYYTKLREPTK